MFSLKPDGGQPQLLGKEEHDKKGDKKAPAQQSHRRNLVADLLGKEVTQPNKTSAPRALKTPQNRF